MDHSQGGIFHSFSIGFKIRQSSLVAASSLVRWGAIEQFVNSLPGDWGLDVKLECISLLKEAIHRCK
jgi:hypothetical protein